MNEPEFSPQEHELIKRLADAPQPSLNPAAFELIRGRMLDAMDVPPAQPFPVEQAVRPLLSAPLIAAAAVALIVLAGGVLLFSNQPDQPVTPIPPIPTDIPTVIPTDLPAITVDVPTAVPTIPPTSDPTATSPVPTDTPFIESVVTLEATPEATADSTPTAPPDAVIIVEGPVQTIVENLVTIYGIEIAFNPDDPLLIVLQVGDVLHIEADYATDTGLIVAITIIPVTDDVAVNPDTGAVWRDDGTCSNPPPAWATANGWRRRCGGAPANANPPGQGQGNQGQGQGNQGQGQGQGRGNNDDDDDD